MDEVRNDAPLHQEETIFKFENDVKRLKIARYASERNELQCNTRTRNRHE